LSTEADKARGMLDTFASVGVRSFDVTFTDLEGRKLERRGFLPSRSTDELRHSIGPLLREAGAQQHNVILRPHKPKRAELIQLDDLTQDAARRIAPHAFMVLCTSPANFQAWIAVADPRPDFARRLRKGAGADPSASGATRISGHPNFKARYAPAFPTVEITEMHLAHVTTRAELENAGLVAAEPPKQARTLVSPTHVGRRKWPSYERCVQHAPPVHQGERPDISKADFVWAMTALDWGWSIKETAARLLEISSKAQENGEGYALTTTQNAADAVERRRAPAR
jgi:hypothetical protein